MPNNKNERKGKQAEELSAEERFRNFFSTSVIDLPEEMTRRDEPAPVEEKPKAGLLGKLFSHDKEQAPAPAQPVLEIPTGEILLGADAKPVQEDMALNLCTEEPISVMPPQPARTEPVKAVPAEPVPRLFQPLRCFVLWSVSVPLHPDNSRLLSVRPLSN